MSAWTMNTNDSKPEPRKLTDRAVLAIQAHGVHLFGTETTIVIEMTRKVQANTISMDDALDRLYAQKRADDLRSLVS